MLIAEDNENPTQWALGRIVKVITGSDGCVRIADIRVADKTSTKQEFTCKTLRRSIHKLSLLPILENKGTVLKELD